MGRLSVIAATMMLSLPWLTWPVWQFKDINASVREVPLFIFTCFALCLAGLVVAILKSIPLGLFVAYFSVHSLYNQTSLSLAATHWVTCAVLMLWVLEYMDENSRRAIKHLLITSGVLMTVYATIQTFQLDPLFFGLWLAPNIFIHGTFGHHNFLGAFLAMLTPIAPVALLPVFLFGLFLSNSLLSFTACFIALAFRFHFVGKRLLLGGSLMLGFTMWMFWNKSHDSLHTRLNSWKLAFPTDIWTFIFGHGPGSWYVLVPWKQKVQGVLESDLFYQAHNEYIQLFFEGGIIALGLLGWWLYENRRIFRNHGVIALGISCAGIYVFHLATLSATAILILGLALRKEKKCESSVRGSLRRDYSVLHL